MDHLKLQIDAKTTYIGQSQKCLDKIQEKYLMAADRSRPFFKFLVQNSIIPLNSALEEYLKLSIEELEKILKPEDDRNEFEILRKLLSIHQIQKLIASEDAKNSEDSINLLNFAEEISKLEDCEVIGPQLKDNIAYQKLFETMEPKVVEVLTKIEKPDDEVMETQSGKDSSKIEKKL
uniref:Uncharacterized protein n=1 Tax=Panagrolaimus superbus TaxID=310955 RepID=A0A914XT54_9BILA